MDVSIFPRKEKHLPDHNHFGKLHFNAESPAQQGRGTSPFEKEILRLHYPNLRVGKGLRGTVKGT